MKKAKPKSRDRDNPDWSESDFDQATHLPGVTPATAVKKARRGRGPQVKPRKVAISIRLSPKIIKHFKSKGRGWQGRMEKVLLKVVGD